MKSYMVLFSVIVLVLTIILRYFSDYYFSLYNYKFQYFKYSNPESTNAVADDTSAILNIWRNTFKTKVDIPLEYKMKSVPDISQLINAQTITTECINRNIACFTTEDCQNFCSDFKVESMQCNFGQCSIMLPTEVQETKCNPKHGIFAVMVGINQLGAVNWECFSLYRDIWNDDDTLVDGVCEGGVIAGDLRVSAFDPKWCQCPEGKTLIYNKTASTYKNKIPRCVKYPHLYMDYISI